jgi:isorenieratene synthase
MRQLFHIGKTLPDAHGGDEPDWVAASPARIDRALARALSRPSGGWYALDASDQIGGTPRRFVVAGEELVAWRASGALHVAPAACPHMGADLSCGRVERGQLVCPWHGLRLDAAGHGRWKPYPAHDDGALLWVRLPEPTETPTDAPVLAPRPASPFLRGVIAMDARCDPEDVIANRLDPWHGVHYHAHSFARLVVLDATDDVITLRVSYRVAGPVCVEVDATFHSPEPRTITMTIVGGEGTGSVVETHATPIAPGKTRVIEATLATSDRPGFSVALRAGRLLRPMIERRAARLWVEDVAYAERRYALRTRESATAPKRGADVVRLRSV